MDGWFVITIPPHDNRRFTPSSLEPLYEVRSYRSFFLYHQQRYCQCLWPESATE